MREKTIELQPSNETADAMKPGRRVASGKHSGIYGKVIERITGQHLRVDWGALGVAVVQEKDVVLMGNEVHQDQDGRTSHCDLAPGEFVDLESLGFECGEVVNETKRTLHVSVCDGSIELSEA